MRFLYLGDIMGEPGREAVQQLLPALRADLQPDLVIAQAENVSHGKGMTVDHMRALQRMGIDFFTGGNHSLWHKSLHPLLDDEDEPVLRPANMPSKTPGRGWKWLQTDRGRVLVISLLGNIVPGGMSLNHPLETIDDILQRLEHEERVATIVNFHGDYSSEKRVIGYYLDGRVSAVLGDHWHVPTADAMILPKGTAHITDVGMCGSVHSSLGIEADIIIERWQTQINSRNELDEAKPWQFNAVFVDVDEDTGLARSIEQVQRWVE